MKVTAFTLPGMFVGIVFTICEGVFNGLPGLVAGLMVTLFLMFGVAGLVATGNALGGLGGVIAWFVVFVISIFCMFVYERWFIDGGPIEGKVVGRDYFSDHVLDVSENCYQHIGVLIKSAPHIPGSYLLAFFIAIIIVGLIVGGKS
jgi:hypothetical protein